VVGLSSLPLLLNVLGSITIGEYLETKKEREKEKGKKYAPLKV
jgi:hypothetical protein